MHNEQKPEYFNRFGFLSKYARFNQLGLINLSKHIYSDAKSRINYNEEGDEQSVKTLEAILRDGIGDCKHFSSFINGALCAIIRGAELGKSCKCYFRFADYGEGIQHVYAVCEVNKKEIPLDPVFGKFGIEKKPYKRTFDIEIF